MTDLILAIAHHLAVFTLFGVLLAEIVLLRPGIAGDRVRQIGTIDAIYGAAAGQVLVIGVLRVLFGDKGADYYIHNWAFWLKMGALVVVGLLSVPPTIAILGWRKKLAADPSFVPGADAVAGLRLFLTGELVAFAFIPAFAVALARGYGIM